MLEDYEEELRPRPKRGLDYQDLRVPEMPQDPVMVDQTVDGARVTIRGNGAEVDFAPGADRVSSQDSAGHAGNLADTVDATEATALARRIIEYVRVDGEARADWRSRMDQGMELMGLKSIPKAELLFDGACGITHPILAEAAVQFQARAIEESFPSEGPVKVRVIGKVTKEREEQAQRVEQHMNYQMVEEDSSYFWHVDQMLFLLPIWGSTFKKTYFDPLSGMVISRFVPAEDFLVPYRAVDLKTTPRYTHILRKSHGELKKLMASGFYREVELPRTSMMVEDTDDAGQPLRDEADSRSFSEHEDDVTHVLYECHIDLELETGEGTAVDALSGRPTSAKGKPSVPMPYVVTVLKESEQILSIRRNWKESDPKRRKRVWFTHYKYLPGLGFYGFGLLHLMGSIAEGCTGTLRALLDSAAFANMQGGFVSKDAGFKENYIRVEAGKFKAVDLSAEELKNAFFNPPFREPSPALAKFFETLVESGRRFASTMDQMVGEGSNTGPVGTTLALIEQASKPFSGIHRRVHVAQGEEFRLRAELNYEFLPDEYPFEIEGDEQLVLRSDYDGRVDVLPVSDPNIFSSTQRIAQAQALMQLATENPDLYDRYEVHRRFLHAIRVADMDSILQKQEPVRVDPVTENTRLMTGKPCKAFPEQDHDAHIAVHETFLASLNGNPEAMNVVGPPMQAHLAEHYALKYWQAMAQQLAQYGVELPPPDELEAEGMPDELAGTVARIAAQMPKMDLLPPPEPPPPDPIEVQMQREQEAFAAEEARKVEAFNADELRKQQAFEREQERKDTGMAAESDRKMAQTVIDETRRTESQQNEEDRRDAQAIREAGRKDVTAKGPAKGGKSGA